MGSSASISALPERLSPSQSPRSSISLPLEIDDLQDKKTGLLSGSVLYTAIAEEIEKPVDGSDFDTLCTNFEDVKSEVARMRKLLGIWLCLAFLNCDYSHNLIS